MANPTNATYFPFDAGPGANSMEARWRAMMRNMISTGVVVVGNSIDTSHFVEPGTGRQVLVNPGISWIQGHMYQHPDGDGQFAIDLSANTSGSTRFDLVTLRLDTDDNIIEYNVIEGTPGGGAPSPVTGFPIWDMPLAILELADSYASLTQNEITDSRVTANHATFRPALILTADMGEVGGHSANINNTASLTFTWNEIEEQNIESMFTSPSDTIFITEPGLYDIKLNVNFRSTSGTPDSKADIHIFVNGSIVAEKSVTMTEAGVDFSGISSRLISLDVGDEVKGQVLNNTNATIQVRKNAGYSPYIQVLKVGEISGLS